MHDLRYSHDTTNLCPVLRRCLFFEEAVLIVKNVGVIYLYTHPRDTPWKYPYLSNTHNTFSCRLAIVHMVLEELRELRTYVNCYKTETQTVRSSYLLLLLALFFLKLSLKLNLFVYMY